jgi:amino acid transporter
VTRRYRSPRNAPDSSPHSHRSITLTRTAVRFLSKINKYTHTPVNAVWFVVLFSIGLNCIAIGSTQTATAIFSITAPALDISYVSVILAHRLYKDKVKFVEGPFTLGKLGATINWVSIVWVLFISTVLFFPPTVPVTASNM